MAQYNITPFGSALEFDTTKAEPISAQRLPGTDKIAAFWVRSTTVVNVQVFSLNRTTGEMTAIGSPLDLETGTAGAEAGVTLTVIDASNLIVGWTSSGSDGFLRLISVDGTGNCTTNGAAFEFDAADGTNMSSVLWDSTHVLVVWTGVAADGFAQVFTISTGAGTIVAVSTPFEFDATDATFNSVIKLDSTHALVAYRGASLHGFMVVLQVAAVTFVVTAAGTALDFDANTTSGFAPLLLSSGSPMVVALYWVGNTGATSNVATFNISTSTWAITAFGAIQVLMPGSGNQESVRALTSINSSKLLLFCPGADSDGYAYIIHYNSANGNLSPITSIEFDPVQSLAGSNAISMDSDVGIYVNVWPGESSDGYIQSFKINLVEANFLMFMPH